MITQRLRVPTVAVLMLLVTPASGSAAADCTVTADDLHALTVQMGPDGEFQAATRTSVDGPTCVTTLVGESGPQLVRARSALAPVAVSILHRSQGAVVESTLIDRSTGDVRTEIRVRDTTTADQIFTVDGPLGQERVTEALAIPMMVVTEIHYPSSWRISVPTRAGMSVSTDRSGTIVRAAGLLFPPITDSELVVGTDATAGRGTPTVTVHATPLADQRNLGIPDGLLSRDDLAVIASFTALAADGSDEIVDAAIEIADGTQELAEGTDELADGTAELADGTRELADGVRELAEAMDDITDAGDEIADALAEIADALEEVADGTAGLDDAMQIAGPLASGVADGVTDLGTTLRQLYEAPPPAGAGLDLTTAPPEIHALLALVDAVIDPNGTDTLGVAAHGLHQIVSQVAANTPELATGLDQLADGTGELADGMQEFAEGLHELADGITDLEEGTADLADGTAELADGTVDLADGTRELAEGLDEFVDGVAEFPDVLRDIVETADRAAQQRARTEAMLMAGAQRAHDATVISAELVAAGSSPIPIAVPVGTATIAGIVALGYFARRRLLGAVTRRTSPVEVTS